jgi:hypothetical protein
MVTEVKFHHRVQVVRDDRRKGVHHAAEMLLEMLVISIACWFSISTSPIDLRHRIGPEQLASLQALHHRFVGLQRW